MKQRRRKTEKKGRKAIAYGKGKKYVVIQKSKGKIKRRTKSTEEGAKEKGRKKTKEDKSGRGGGMKCRWVGWWL